MFSKPKSTDLKNVSENSLNEIIDPKIEKITENMEQNVIKRNENSPPSLLSTDLFIKGNLTTDGDIQIEGNLELRFPFSSWVEGAFFVDMGNVWLLREDSIRTQGQFRKESFLNEIAIGSGLGLRLNLDFFIIRVDVAMPIKNPAISLPNNRWVFGKSTAERQQFYPVQFNLGIGYPF